jgi:hypothetical protein
VTGKTEMPTLRRCLACLIAQLKEQTKNDLRRANLSAIRTFSIPTQITAVFQSLMVSPVGLEPTAPRLKVSCSTN